jgi:hypothetical protein
MKQGQISIVLSLLAVFASGMAVGAFGYHKYALKTVSATVKPQVKSTPEEWRRKYVEEMRSRLQLDDNQVTRLHTILDDTKSRFIDLKQRSKQETEQIKTEQSQAIRAMLSPSQAPEYDRFREERARKMKENAAREKAAKEAAAKAGN